MKEIYLHMIRKAQEFMNENHYADISRVHCLLRKMMPKEYHDVSVRILGHYEFGTLKNS